jgi:hypothetical protein
MPICGNQAVAFTHDTAHLVLRHHRERVRKAGTTEGGRWSVHCRNSLDHHYEHTELQEGVKRFGGPDQEPPSTTPTP